MTAKEYLRQIRRLDEVINVKLEQLDELRSMAERVTSAPPTLDRVQPGGGDQDKLGTVVAKIVDLSSTLADSEDELLSMRQHALELIKRIPDSRHKTVLYDYYFNRKTWEQIAVDMGFTYQWVRQLHGRALQEFEKLWES